MTTDTRDKLEVIRNLCQAAQPDKTWTVTVGVGYSKGLPIQLTDVLVMFGKHLTSHDYLTVGTDGNFFTKDKDTPWAAALVTWDLEKTLFNQSEEVIDFIYNSVQ